MRSEYPPDWDVRRKKVYQRDNYTCQNCGAQGGPYGNAELHAHHIVPKSKGGTHEISNLQTVCSGCHDAIHENKMAPTTTVNRQVSTSKSKRTRGVEDWKIALGVFSGGITWFIFAPLTFNSPDYVGAVLLLLCIGVGFLSVHLAEKYRS